MILIGLALFCLSMTTWAARNVSLLMVSNAMMMVCIPIIGSSTFQILEYTSTLGNFFFASMIHGLTLRHRIYGQAAARETVRTILLALTLVFGAMILINAHEPNSLFVIPARMMVASFTSFWLVQSILIHGLTRYRHSHPLLSIPAASVAMHLLACAIFFPCAFLGVLSREEVLRFSVLGWLTRSSIAILAIPFVLHALWSAGQWPERRASRDPRRKRILS